MNLPEYLLKIGNKSEANRSWVNSLPAIIRTLAHEWDLKLGTPFLANVSCAYVVPCKVEDKYDAILKIGMPHVEAKHEIDGLVVLNGNPTVKMLRFDRATNSMLLERCDPGSHLNLMTEDYQDETICAILPHIWKAEYQSGQFRPLSDMVALWNSETLQDLDKFPDAELAITGCRIKEALVSNGEEQVLLAT